MPFKTKEQHAAYMREWRAKNPEKHRESVRKWKERNRDKHKEYLAGYRKRKRGKFTAHEAKRRAKVMRAVPVWLTPEQQKEIFEIYDRAGKLPGYEVDHIVPISSPHVCGLHVPWNLQIIPAKQNARKGNKLIEE